MGVPIFGQEQIWHVTVPTTQFLLKMNIKMKMKMKMLLLAYHSNIINSIQSNPYTTNIYTESQARPGKLGKVQRLRDIAS